MKNENSIWNFYAPVYNLFMRINRPAYREMQAFARKLRDSGYEKAELIDTTKGLFMTKKEAAVLSLNGSTILYGIK